MRYRHVALGLLVGLLFASYAEAAPLTIGPNERIVFLGTSITSTGAPGGEPWYAPALTAINAHYTIAATILTNATASATTSKATATCAPIQQAVNTAPTVFNAGVSGNTIAQMTARVTSDVVAHSPTIVVIEGSVNDVATPIGTYQTNTMALVSALQGGLPGGTKYAWVGVFCDGESYPDVTWGSTISAMETANMAAASALGATYIDVRTPQQAYEAINHATPPLTVDGVHPNMSLGIPMYSDTFSAQIILD